VREKGVTLNGEAINISADDSNSWRELLADPAQTQVDVSLSGVTKPHTLKVDWFAATGPNMPRSNMTTAPGSPGSSFWPITPTLMTLIGSSCATPMLATPCPTRQSSITGSFKGAIDAVGDLVDASSKFGISVEQLAGLKYAAELAGGGRTRLARRWPRSASRRRMRPARPRASMK
jgi:hypothetical protein